ncbi:hypothetical protein BGW80DRAFT_1446082 [Lactifluus volemus]|nr:hypothetical protein BGW80DRAFT_1446082 [Lactifluus volemus]
MTATSSDIKLGGRSHQKWGGAAEALSAINCAAPDRKWDIRTMCEEALNGEVKPSLRYGHGILVLCLKSSLATDVCENLSGAVAVVREMVTCEEKVVQKAVGLYWTDAMPTGNKTIPRLLDTAPNFGWWRSVLAPQRVSSDGCGMPEVISLRRLGGKLVE